MIRGVEMPITKMRMRLLEDGRPQYRIAADLGVPPSRISEYALGRRAIPTKLLYDFVRLWGCGIDDILGYEPDDGIEE
jgi:hypothetical protein